MARFSALGGDDGEGPSNPKRRRTSTDDQTHSDDCRPPEEEEEEEEEEEANPEQEGEQEGETEERDEGEDGGSGAISLTRVCRSRRSDRSNGGGEASVAVAGRDGLVLAFLTDLEVLDCSICFEPLSLPVFQCENGHTACSSCCVKLTNKCPSCCFPIGYNRCRAVEKVLESVQVSCQYMKYGCIATLKYSEKRDHEKLCNYSPCSCPHIDCTLLASSDQLSQHICHNHPDSVRQFFYNSQFHLLLHVNDRFLVLREEDTGELFVLRNRIALLGNVVMVNRFCSNSAKGELPYELIARNGDESLTLISSTENSSGRIESPCSKGFLLVPKSYFDTSLRIKLEVRIWNGPTEQTRSLV